MNYQRRSRHHAWRGFSLVEIMVSVVVGMLGILVIMQVFLVAEGQKRTTTGGADAQENGLMAMFTLERELRTAGLGLVGLGCTTVNSFNVNRVPPNYSFNPWPVTIARDTTRNAAGNVVAAPGTDMITLLYSDSPFGNIPTTLTSGVATSNQKFTVVNGDGFEVGNLAMISESPKACTLTEISQAKEANGSSWDLRTSGLPYNPPVNNSPPAPPAPPGYGAGARLTNMGSLINHEYYVRDNNLMMRDVDLPNSATNPIALVSGVVAIRAQYGWDTNADGYVDAYNNTSPAAAADVIRISAVQLAVVARSGQQEKIPVAGPCNPVVLPTDLTSSCNLVLWSGGTTANGGLITLDATARKYRYKIYQTTIPLRNVLWGNN